MSAQWTLKNLAFNANLQEFYYFCGLGQESDEIKALYGLRNSFIHDVSNVYRGHRRNNGSCSGPFHVFRLDKRRDASSLVEFPSSSWDGDITNFRLPEFTIVFTRQLSWAACKAIDKAKEMLEANDLEILISSPSELFHRYLFLRADG